MHVRRNGKSPGSGRSAAEHCKELGKEKLIVALRCDATISDNSRGCVHTSRLVLLKSCEQGIERAVSLDRHFPRHA